MSHVSVIRRYLHYYAQLKMPHLSLRQAMQRIRGFIDLVFDLTEEITNLVEETHDKVVQRTLRRFASLEPVTTAATAVTGIETAISGTVFKSIRGINTITRLSLNTAADLAEAGAGESLDDEDRAVTTPMQSSAAGTPGWAVDYAQSSINGLWGDYLVARNNRLALDMTLRHNGQKLAATAEAFASAFPRATPKICIFVHSLAATEWLWSLSSEHYYGDPGVTFGSRLADDLGFTPIYMRYNTGLHISANGRKLAALISEILALYPVPIEEIMLVGHSMGGLVARSAAHYGQQHDEPWIERLRHVACIGAPNLGAPLEKTVNLLSGVLRNVEAAGAQVPARILDSRSAGVKDLRYGYTVDEEWAGKDPDAVFADARRNIPLVDGVGYYFVAATISRDLQHPLGQLLGDLLVRLPSATGEAPETARRIDFARGKVFPGMNHIHIANHPDIYEALRELVAP
jgi:pimeloyl-ACP methyl ester carboxylesterase